MTRVVPRLGATIGASWIILAIAVAPCVAADPTVSVWVEPRTGATDADLIQLMIRVDGEESPGVTTPRLPDMINLRVVGGPSSSNSFRWVNGQASASLTLTYSMVADGPGPAEIPSFVVTVDGRDLVTEPIRFTISKGASAPPPGSQPTPPRTGQGGREEREAAVHVRATLSADEAYVGQPVALDVTLLTAERLQGFEWVEVPTFSDFWVEDDPVEPTAERYVTTVGGRRYDAFPLVRKYLIPTNDGEFEVGQWVARTTVVRSSGDLLNDFFGRSRGSVIVRRSAPLRLRVRALPTDGQPTSFTGAVGRFEMETRLDRGEVEVDDAVALRVMISGDGLLKAIQPPELAGPPDLKIFEPKTEESVSRVDDRLVSRKAWEWILVPLGAGEIRIPEVRFSYFDPVDGTYRELVEDNLLLTVHRGSGGADRSARGGRVRAQRREISFIKPRRGPLREDSPRVHRRGWFVVLFLLPLVVVPLAVLAGRWHARLARDQGLVRSRKARTKARRRLATLEKKASQTDSGPFHEGVARALVDYVADRFDRPAAGLTYDGIEDLLASRGIDGELRGRFRSCVERCDFARFVPSAGAAERRAEVLDEARAVVDALENVL